LLLIEEGFMGPVSTEISRFYQDEHLTMDFDGKSAVLDSQVVVLTRKEYDLLSLLVMHAGQIIPREALLMRVWGYSSEIRTRTLDVHIRRLRKRIERDDAMPELILTVRGVGYKCNLDALRNE